MAQSTVLTGAHLRVYLNGVLFGSAQSIQYTLDTGDQEIYGIDAIYPQEIVPVKSQIRGSVSGLRVINTGGLQAKGIRSKANDVLRHPYITIRIQDRKSGEDILFVPKARVSSESFSGSAKGTVKVSFNFMGIIPLQPLDRNGG